MKTKLMVKCPYCGSEQGLEMHFQDTSTEKRIVTCDQEYGGCEKDYVVEARPEIKKRIRTLSDEVE